MLSRNLTAILSEEQRGWDIEIITKQKAELYMSIKQYSSVILYYLYEYKGISEGYTKTPTMKKNSNYGKDNNK